MGVLSSHDRGLTPDMSAEARSSMALSLAKRLQTAPDSASKGHGRGLTPDVSEGDAR
jgi:hypothetical protein